MDQLAASDDPTQQVFFLIGPDGVTQIPIPVPIVNRDQRETARECINFGSQIGACITMLIVVLLMTPAKKLLKTNTVVYIVTLAICIVKMFLLALYFVSGWSEFYAWYTGDFSRVQTRDYALSVTGDTFSLILLICIETGLILQAWAMAKIWQTVWKYTVGLLSVGVCLSAVGFRFSFAVLRNKAVLETVYPEGFDWVAQGTLITACVSICWFCALFNAPLATHLIKNRGVLPSRRGLNPMEVLIITNGVLMIVPGESLKERS
jgi:pheromone alpha factor receptor